MHAVLPRLHEDIGQASALSHPDAANIAVRARSVDGAIEVIMSSDGPVDDVMVDIAERLRGLKGKVSLRRLDTTTEVVMIVSV